MRFSRAISFLLLLAGVALAAGLSYFGWHRFIPQGFRIPQPPQAPIGIVTRGTLTLKVTAAGTIIPKRKAVITAPYNGYIKKLFVKVGDHIREGAPVVAIAQTIGKSGGDDETFPLRAPLTGRVVQVWRDEGEYVGAAPGSPDQAIVRIDDLSQLFVQASVPEIEIGKLKVGQAVTIRALAAPSQSYSGRILTIMLAAREGDRWEKSKVEFPIQVEVTESDGQLRPGMSAILDVIVAEAQNVLTLPHEFIQKSGEEFFATLVDGTRKRLEVGLKNEDAFEIKSGLSEGDRVRQVDFLAESALP